MSRDPVGPIITSVGGYSVLLDTAEPAMLADYREHAALSEHFEIEHARHQPGFLFVAVHDDAVGAWPQLVITQEFQPAGSGFHPGVLLLPDTGQLFVGAGIRLLGYDIRSGEWRRRWLHDAELGFWNWRRHGNVVLMSAELELAAWNTHGEKLWNTFVEPPWSYTVHSSEIDLEIMGVHHRFPLQAGPQPGV